MLHSFCLKDGIGGSYRLPSLDRLAYKQRLLQENGGLGLVERNGNGTGGSTTADQSSQKTAATGAQHHHISTATALVREDMLLRTHETALTRL